jgi:hypothetical protein
MELTNSPKSVALFNKVAITLISALSLLTVVFYVLGI